MKNLVLSVLVLSCLVLLASSYPYEDRQYLSGKGGSGVRLSYDNRDHAGYGWGGYGGGSDRGYGGYGGYRGGYDGY